MKNKSASKSNIKEVSCNPCFKRKDNIQHEENHTHAHMGQQAPLLSRRRGPCDLTLWSFCGKCQYHSIHTECSPVPTPIPVPKYKHDVAALRNLHISLFYANFLSDWLQSCSSVLWPGHLESCISWQTLVATLHTSCSWETSQKAIVVLVGLLYRLYSRAVLKSQPRVAECILFKMLQNGFSSN